jgi:two-component system, chemotaxis family, protein-glutamate methylesterase/glutaminase
MDPSSALPRTVVGIGSSAGGIHALTTILTALPASLPAPVLVVQHLDPRHPSVLAQLLDRASTLPVRQASEGDLVEAGVVLAPPGHHMVLNEDGTVSLNDDPLIHFVRPSVDVLFASIARVCAAGGIGVILSGGGTDGADGIRAIKGAGGTVLAQDQATSQVFGMPGAAIDTGLVDRVLPLEAIPAALEELVMART